MHTYKNEHFIRLSTRQQSLSTKCQESWIGRVTASRFVDILLQRSLPSESFVKSFLRVSNTLLFQLKSTTIFKTRQKFVVHIVQREVLWYAPMCWLLIHHCPGLGHHQMAWLKTHQRNVYWSARNQVPSYILFFYS